MRARIDEERKAMQIASEPSRDAFAEAREREYKENSNPRSESSSRIDRGDRSDRISDRNDRAGDRGDRSDRISDRNDRTGDRNDRTGDRDKDRRRDSKESGGTRTAEREEQKSLREKEKEMAAIRAQYLGAKKEKKKPVKPSEKFKFSFDWELSDDTSRDLNPLYNNPHEAMLMYGRGMRAGIDPEEQKKQYNYYAEKFKEKLKEQREEHKKLGDAEKDKEREKQKQKKERHWSEKELTEMSDRDWRIFKEDYNIVTKGGSVPRPIRSWKESNLPGPILETIKKLNYKLPTPIQMQAIPVGLLNRDIIGIAETGSGKTIAFVIPMLVWISKLPKMTPETETEGPYAVVLAPTRELALQIENETSKFSKAMGIRTFAVVGGQPIEEQAFQLRQGCEILIATPGRLNDCLDRRYLVLNQCTYVVLDEADRMIDMGFEPQVNAILDAMPLTNLKPEDLEEDTLQKEIVNGKMYRQTIMFSATLPVGVERLARKFLRRPVVVSIGEIGRVVDRIEQRVDFCNEADKRRRLTELLNSEDFEPPIIVFVNQKKGCDVLAKALDKLGFRATTLHGGKTQEQREVAMDYFKTGRYDILVATDVAGRGIDVKGVTMVVNFDMPKSIEDYTHRIGRTGRAGQSGKAVSFVTREDTEVMYDLKQMLIQCGAPVPQELANHEAAQFKPGSVPDRVPRRSEKLFCI